MLNVNPKLLGRITSGIRGIDSNLKMVQGDEFELCLKYQDDIVYEGNVVNFLFPEGNTLDNAIIKFVNPKDIFDQPGERVIKSIQNSIETWKAEMYFEVL